MTSPDFAQPPEPPRRIELIGNTDQGDVTSLNWNTEGTLFAAGSYDFVLRIFNAAGDIYFSHTLHQVSNILDEVYFRVLVCIDLPERVQFLLSASPKMVNGCYPPVWTAPPASGTSRRKLWLGNIWHIRVCVRVPRSVPVVDRELRFSVTDCCLDVDWLSDTLFASCSADTSIHIMQIDKAEPIKTLKCVMVLPLLLGGLFSQK